MMRLITLLLAITGCVLAWLWLTPITPAPPTTTQNVPNTATRPENGLEKMVCHGPVRVAALVDKTGSANQNRTPSLVPADFAPLYDLLKLCGGELAVGTFTSHSNRPLLRLRLEGRVALPAPTDPRMNPLEYDDRHAEELKLRARAEGLNRERDGRAAEAIAAFDAALGEMLSEPASAPCSDIAGGIRRAALFENEPATSWGDTPPLNYLASVGDMEHNCGSPTLAPMPETRILLINGTPGDGILAGHNITRLESFDAAVNLIATEALERRKEQQ